MSNHACRVSAVGHHMATATQKKSGADDVQVSPATIKLDDEHKTVLINNLLVEEREVHEYLSRAVASEHTGLLVRALRVGSVALRDAVTASKVDYVQREFATLKASFAERMTVHFGPHGDVTKLIEAKFGDDGEVQQKLAGFLSEDGTFAQVLDQFLGEKGPVQTLLGEDGTFDERLEKYFGPKGILREHLDETFGEKGGQLQELLSHKNEKGPMGSFMKDLHRMFNPDVEGSPIAQLRLEIRQQFAALYKDFGQALGKAEEKVKGTAKGAEFQDWVFDELQAAAALVGDAVDEVGEKKGIVGKTGDVQVTLNSDDLRGITASIIFEAKNESVSLRGKDTIYAELDRAIKNRNADFAIAVVHPDHSKSDIAPFVFRAPNTIVCVANQEASLPLQVAYRMARTLVMARRSAQKTGLDQETVTAIVRRVEAKLTEFSSIYSQLTKVQSDLKGVSETLKGIAAAITSELTALLEKSSPK